LTRYKSDYLGAEFRHNKSIAYSDYKEQDRAANYEEQDKDEKRTAAEWLASAAMVASKC